MFWKSLVSLTIALFSFSAFGPALQATDMRSAIDQAASMMAKNRKIKKQVDRSIVIELINRHSHRKDEISKQIESEFYQALGTKLPQHKLFFLDDSLTGINLNKALIIRGEYNKQGPIIEVFFRAALGTQGRVLAQARAIFEAPKAVAQSLVAVLDLEAPALNKNQKKVYSDIFRGALAKEKTFQLASSAEVSRMNPDDIQQSYGCTRDECATIIGEQLGVDRVISSSYLKVGEGVYFLSAKIMDIKSGAILATETVEHDGKIQGLRKAVSQLAQLLAKETTPAPKFTAPPVATYQAPMKPTPPVKEIKRKRRGWPWWSYVLIGAGVVVTAAAATADPTTSSSSSSSSTSSTSSSSGGTGSATVTW